MKPLRRMTLGLMALLGLSGVNPVHAGWQGVFQVTCFHRSQPTVSASYYADPCCNPCPCPPPCPFPQTVVTTRYVQRTYYQPVTCYQTKTYYEPVTTYRTSYYYEPVTTCRYTCCYDPCTCSYHMVATPVTCYRLRSQCCPVTNFVQRCCYVPVTTYRQCCYWEAQTCTSLVDPCTGAVLSLSQPASAAGAPAVTESHGTTPVVPAQPGVQEQRSGGTSSPLYNEQYQQRNKPAVPPGNGSSLPRTTPTQAQPARPPIVPKLDRIAVEDGNWKPVQTASR